MPCYAALLVDKVSSRRQRQRRVVLVTYRRLIVRYIPTHRVRRLLRGRQAGVPAVV
eukprot:gene3007-7590_t